MGHFKHSALATYGLMKKQKVLGFKNTLCCPRSANEVEQHLLYATETRAIKAAYTPVPGGYND